MSDTFESVTRLVAAGSVRVSEHGYDELMADGIFSRDIVTEIGDGKVVEDYPIIPKDPVFWCYRETGMVIRYTSCGAFLKGTRNQRLL
jgi:hypothetical protein